MGKVTQGRLRQISWDSGGSWEERKTDTVSCVVVVGEGKVGLGGKAAIYHEARWQFEFCGLSDEAATMCLDDPLHPGGADSWNLPIRYGRSDRINLALISLCVWPSAPFIKLPSTEDRPEVSSQPVVNQGPRHKLSVRTRPHRAPGRLIHQQCLFLMALFGTPIGPQLGILRRLTSSFWSLTCLTCESISADCQIHQGNLEP